ncbi:MAG TPA: hypothetical protein VJV96_06665 [Candidatus Angelobacter sp.]|jgi:hypothetical protein|nr:hypothetical protein [Candidatus Angelobacter sp.]
MGLMDAKEYDPRPAQRRWRLLVTALVIVLAVFLVWWFFRFFPENRVINKFFHAIEHKDYDTAYGLYFADPEWKQHPQKYNQYPLPQFMLDWGPSSEYGTITSHKIECTTEPPTKAYHSPTGVIVVVSVNNRPETTSMWVEKKSKSISLSPQEVICHPPK